MRLLTVLMTVCCAQVALFANTTDQRFLRVEIYSYDNHSNQPTEVKMRLPITMFNAFKGNFDVVMSETGFEENYSMWSEAWKEVVAMGPHDFVEIKDGDTWFKLSTTATHLVITAEAAEHHENVDIRVPLILGSVLFDGDAFPTMEELMFALSELPTNSLLELEAHQVDMRVWIE